MPWKPSDAETHNKACKDAKKAKVWAEVANKTRDSAIKDKKPEAEADRLAIATANKAVADMKESEGGESRAETLQEYASSGGISLRVDRDKGIVHGVKILGMESLNGRTYLPAAVAGAIGLYEGVKVNVNHVRSAESRLYQDRMGVLRGVVAKADGLYGDFHFNPKHALAEQLCWDAEHAPGNVGFSHDCDAKTSRKDGRTIVEAITRVASVDLVANPATTKGLFEGEIGDKVADDERSRQLRKINCTAQDFISQVLYDDEQYPTVAAKKARIQVVLQDWESELSKLPVSGGNTSSPKESTDMGIEYKDLTVESLKEHRQDIVEQLTGTDAMSKLQGELQVVKESLTTAQTELTALKAEKAEAAKALAINEEIKAAGLNAADTVAVSEVFMGQLKAAPDAAARKPLLEERVNLLKTFSQGRSPVTGAAPMAPLGAGATAPVRDSFSEIIK